MPVIQVSYDLPAEIAAGLATGAIQRFGSVVRDSNKIIAHLKEVGTADEKAGVTRSIFRGGFKNPGSIIAIGIGVIAVVGGAVYLAGSRKKNATKARQVQTVERYNASLVAYLQAITAGKLDESNLKKFREDVGALNHLVASGEVSVEFSQDYADALKALLADYTQKLAQANAVELAELPELNPGTTEALMKDIQLYLVAQQGIIDGDG